MTAFKHPAFAKLSPKIERAARELQQVEIYLSAHESEMSVGEWGPVSAVSLGIHNVYNGIEDILLSLANDVDGLVPSGPTLHQDVLDVGGNRGSSSRSARSRAVSVLERVEGFPPFGQAQIWFRSETRKSAGKRRENAWGIPIFRRSYRLIGESTH